MKELKEEITLQAQKVYSRLKELDFALQVSTDVSDIETKKLEKRWLVNKLTIIEPFLNKIEDGDQAFVLFLNLEKQNRTTLYQKVKAQKTEWEQFCIEFEKGNISEEEIELKVPFIKSLHQNEAQLNAYQQLIPIVTKYIS